ncbi:alginate export family protein [Novosphingobium sp. KACC 22771]|uniref:alginate export family protein n=1 Tax=Novosphingobium sp. KACC 22771 TaxID=3025670 RepID=UPI002365508D|nr:alginate export family protein [Novosphingobium sp. KACC 22771]WDF71190.1 alginate export family protein [Novosphingobium sp. KACC 22771]
MIRYLLTAAPVALIATNAYAAPGFGDPVPFADGTMTFDPIVDARLRWEDVDATTKSADAVTLRVRAGAEIKHKASGLSALVEGAGTVALDDHYSGFPYANLASSQYHSTQAVIPDPQNAAFNRFQIAYQKQGIGLTIGRQRINLDDQRFVGSVAWRQNEQTFDAARAAVNGGPISLDATYAISQRSIFGNDGGARTAYNGRFIFLNGGLKNRIGSIKGFAYILDYDKTAFSNAAARSTLDSSQTYGLRGNTAPIRLAKGISFALTGSYANQRNYDRNVRAYSADYYFGEGALTVMNTTFTGGYEELGADRGAAGGTWSFQTPMATLHKFNGTADLFLTTPANGLADTYVGVSGKFPKVKALPGLNYGATYHWFGSAVNGLKYGNELDAQIGFKISKITWLVKYADYQAKGFGADTKKFWLQAEYLF